MPITINIIGEVDYFLPDDMLESIKAITDLLYAPGDTYIDCYGLSQPDIADHIIAADSTGVNISIACDHLQACGSSTKATLARINEAFKTRGKSTITITTAGPLSDVPGSIYHKKCMVVKALDGDEDYCMEGSLNMTSPGSKQANTLRIFRSNEWAAKEISDHVAVCAWANAVHPEWQLVNGLGAVCE
jgi:hypothetical protein